MSESADVVLEKRGTFWWHGEKTPRGRYAPPFGVPGVLTIKEDGKARLNVTESLLQSKFLDMASPNRALLDGDPEAFEGKSIAGKVDGQSRCVYLKKIVYRSLGQMVDGKPSEQFESDLCLVGNTTTTRNPGALWFSKLSIELSGLEEWMWNDSIVVKREEQNADARSQNVSYTARPFAYEIEDGTISLQSDVHCSALEELPYREIFFRQYDTLEYIRAKSTTPEALWQEFNHIEEFFAILTGTYFSLKWPSIAMNVRDKVETYTLYFWRNIENSMPPGRMNLWTTFPQVRNSFGTLYSNWRNKRREYGPGFYLYLGSLRKTPMYIEHRFVNLIWGIESLHRGMNPERTVSKSQTKKIGGILSKAGHLLNLGERSWLDRQLRMSVEPPLEYRIASTFAALPWKITKSSLDLFAIRCRIRRNNISHYGGPGEKDESYEAFLRELMELTEGVAPLYHAALLQEIGVDDKTLMDSTKMPIGFKIRRGLELAKLNAEGIKAPDPVDLKPLLKAQKINLRKWRRRQLAKS